jgi:dTDP-4-amino-4,6-dideoxygalactose transaminase
MINFASPIENNKKYKSKILFKLSKVISSNKYILGNENKILEKKIKEFTKAKYAITLNSGTDALICSLIAAGIKSGDEVIAPSHTATATITAIKSLKARVKFADISKEDFNIDITDLKKKISKKTKAIIVVHIYGNPAEIDKIISLAKNKKISIIEDCAQAMGTKFKNKHVGTFGDFGCLSFFPTKNLSAIGDAGAIILNSKANYEKLLKIRQYGWNDKRISVMDGINSRCDEMQASILNLKIDDLNKFILNRRRIASFYNKKLAKLPIILPIEREKGKHSYHLYVIRISSKLRKKFLHFMKKKGVNLGIHYYPPTHTMKIFKTNIKLKNTDYISKQIVSLPMYPELKNEELNYIVNKIKLFFNKT